MKTAPTTWKSGGAGEQRSSPKFCTIGPVTGTLPAKANVMQTVPQDGVPASRRFAGTDNPRLKRVIKALLAGPVTREQVDRIGGASNGPALVAALRKRGLELPCDRRTVIDRDGQIVNPGIYSLTDVDKGLIADWLARGGTLDG